jgi:hypothetical protein
LEDTTRGSKENQGITEFKASRHNMWIKEKRDPMKEWLQLRYCVTTEEVQWAMKDWPEEWKVPIVSKKGSKGKKQAEVGTSKKTNSPTTNTRKETEPTKETGGSTTVRKPRKRTLFQILQHRRRTTQK